MPHPIRSFVVAGSLLAVGTGLAACGSSGGSDAASTTRATTTTTATTEAPTTTAPTTATTTDPAITTSTYTGKATGLPDCQVLLQEYTDRFTMDDLDDAAAFFREYAPYMPDDVGAASLRIAAAYKAAKGDPANLDFADVDLTADAQTFSDWTNDGCPAG